jgi:hypothetical protein
MMLALTACQQGGGEGTDTASQGVTLVQQQTSQTDTTDGDIANWSDLDIAEAIYTDQRTPEDFYQVKVPDDAFYTTYQLKNTDLVAAADRDGMPVYELSTDDFSQALQWVETAAQNRPVYKQLVDTTETDLYYQFTRVDLANPQYIDNYRVFKSNVMDRSGVDITNPDSFQGTITQNPVSAARVKTIDEYLWTFSYANNYGTAILQSTVTEYSGTFAHTMFEARLAPAFDGSCDTITVVAMTYSVDKMTGDIDKEEDQIRTLYAQRDQYGFKLCSAT